MGNHQAGRAMGKTAEALAFTNLTALAALDMICNPYRGCDAEFEAEDPNRPGHIHPEYADYTDPNGPIGKLIIEAFGETGKDYYGEWGEAEQDAWFDGPYTKFKDRYEFC